MRGKVVGDSADGGTLGITPAYAGKSDRVKHCGTMLMGSPPPMRGKVPDVFLQGLCTRITPAYAGKRQVQKLGNYGVRDHPRLCGEKDQVPQLIVLHKGSPPPMRGKVGHE